jgi:hypothetical protein
VLLAAADYNRALAHAPDDPQLLRIVAGLNRAEARSKMMRRAGAALVLMVGLGAATYGVGRLVQRVRGDIRPVPTEVQTEAPASVPTLAASAPMPSANAAPSASTAARFPQSTGVPPVPKVVDRSVQLDLTPSMGVKVTIDGAETRDVASGEALRLDNKAHTLAFTCFLTVRDDKGATKLEEVCSPVQRTVAAGDKDDTLVVKVPIKPATLDIDGPVDKTYQVVEHPQLRVRAGLNTIAVGSVFESITVKQIDSNKTVSVRLHAGKSMTVTF